MPRKKPAGKARSSAGERAALIIELPTVSQKT
jgi:hypothetical protein